MASMGDIIFWSMIVLIVAFTTLIILFFAVSLNGSSSLFSVVSNDRSPIGILGEDVLLSCHVNAEQVTEDVSVTWTKAELSGVVYKYEDRAPQLADQNPQFEGRTRMFPSAVASGNSSLLMAGVESSDDGVYTCSISTSSGAGSVNIHLRTGAYSAPTFRINNSTLIAMGSKWQPEPELTWLAFNGTVLQGITQFSKTPAGEYSFVSTLTQISVDSIYIFRVQTSLVTASSTTTITGSGVEETTRFSFSISAGTSLSPSKCLVPLFSLLIYVIGST